jgi:hypothetical protein
MTARASGIIELRTNQYSPIDLSFLKVFLESIFPEVVPSEISTVAQVGKFMSIGTEGRIVNRCISSLQGNVGSLLSNGSGKAR